MKLSGDAFGMKRMKGEEFGHMNPNYAYLIMHNYAKVSEIHRKSTIFDISVVYLIGCP